MKKKDIETRMKIVEKRLEWLASGIHYYQQGHTIPLNESTIWGLFETNPNKKVPKSPIKKRKGNL